MKLVPIIVCATAVAFMMRFLIALLKEGKSQPPQRVKVHFAKFIPSKRRGELIVIKPEALQRKLPLQAAKCAAFFVAIALAALPLHSQQSASNPNNSDNHASTSNQQNTEAIQKELDAMKQRIAQLEAELKKHQESEPADTVVHTVKASTPAVAPASSSMVTVPAEAALPESTPPEKKKPAEPFAFADWTWLNGNPRTKEPAFDSKFFTPEIRADVAYHYDFNHPKDDTIGGSSEVFRSNEISLTHLGVGGDFHYDNVRARIFSQLGLYSTATPRNDASYSRGQWQLDNAYRYLNEAYGGYHFDALHGINVDAGIFLSYVGLFSFYQFDNWAYQPSYVSSNTPWFFTGMRIQVFPTEKLKIEPWIINGWQSYARPNGRLGLGGQILWRPAPWV